MKKLLTLTLVFAAIAFSGCGKARNRWAANGGFFASVSGGIEGDYIVISQSGGKIMDIWKLRGAICQSPEGSDGWLFRDNAGNPVNIAGDVKVVRMVNFDAGIWNSYHEYHMELERISYREKYHKN